MGETINADRRRFLQNTGVGAVTGAALAALANAQSAFGAELTQSRFIRDGDFDWNELKKSYSLDPKINYLNHASIGSIPIAVQRARSEYLQICESNPWLYMWGGAWEESREQVRRQAADLFGCRSTEIAITHNTTEVFNTLAHGLPLKPRDEVLFSSLNHAGASIAFEQAARQRGYKTRRFEFPTRDAFDLTADRIVEIYVEQIAPSTRLLVFPHIDNTLGLRYPVGELAAAARNKGVEFVAVDGAQSAGMIELNVRRLGVDVYATSAHKWLGSPKGVGLAFFAKPLQTRLRPMWTTWGQSKWNGSARIYEDYGTRNLPEVIALGDALKFHRKINGQARMERLSAIHQHVMEKAQQTESVRFVSPKQFSAGSAVMLLELSSRNANQIAKSLFQQHGIVVRAFKSSKRNAVRVSPNVYTTLAEIDQLFEVLAAS